MGRIGRIFCCQPSYGHGSPGSHKQFWVGASKEGDSTWGKINFLQFGGSLLASCFNKMWAAALNAQMDGEDITHFAMLHDDIIPEDGWLTKLAEDLETSGADVLSAVVPIKDTNGVTSTAIDDPENPFVVERRLTLHEVLAMPEVFTSKDCGYPDRALLLNTGCWICDFTKPWRFDVFFTIRDRMVFCCSDGKRLPADTVLEKGPDGSAKLKAEYQGNGYWDCEVAPEDWNFSRMVHAAGGKLAATRRVKLHHEGSIQFDNQTDWGAWKYDEAFRFRQISALHRPQTASHRFPDVRGWMYDNEGQSLAKWAKGQKVIEIGSYCGLSTLWLATTADQVLAVDTFEGDGVGTHTGGSTLGEFTKNVDKYDTRRVINYAICNTKTDAKELIDLYAETQFDFAFIDGSHDYASVRRDYETVMQMMAPLCVICFHDYKSNSDPDVTRAVDEIIREDNAKVLEQSGGCIFIQPVNRHRPLAYQTIEVGESGISS